MFYAKTQKIMRSGIEKYSIEFNSESVQILLKPIEDDIEFHICKDWQPNKSVSFLDIMNKKIDILGIEMIAKPYLYKSAIMYQKKYKDEGEVDTMIFKDKKELKVAVFLNKKAKEILTLEKQFERLGL